MPVSIEEVSIEYLTPCSHHPTLRHLTDSY